MNINKRIVFFSLFIAILYSVPVWAGQGWYLLVPPTGGKTMLLDDYLKMHEEKEQGTQSGITADSLLKKYGYIKDDQSKKIEKERGATKTPQTGSIETPPVEGARKAPDGKWYLPDPARPGKYLRVDPAPPQPQTGTPDYSKWADEKLLQELKGESKKEDNKTLDLSAPLSKWNQIRAFDTAKECENYEDKNLERLTKLINRWSSDAEKANKFKKEKEKLVAGNCIASDDPRLKP